MFAIVEILGFQYKVSKNQKLFVNYLNKKIGDNIFFDKILLYSNNNENISIGVPTIHKQVIEARILDHIKGDKVIVFKSKKRKGYKVKIGHRQRFTKIQILSI